MKGCAIEMQNALIDDLRGRAKCICTCKAMLEGGGLEDEVRG
jgi:hypothetical protein